ncbi:hypothetical protein EDB19DRAFT_534546 [Suillus lakei]|nr:hypothetical protein EDB19DRAFT_534546 [Suillus lakei]
MHDVVTAKVGRCNPAAPPTKFITHLIYLLACFLLHQLQSTTLWTVNGVSQHLPEIKPGRLSSFCRGLTKVFRCGIFLLSASLPRASAPESVSQCAVKPG